MAVVCPVVGAGIRRPDAFTKLHFPFDNEGSVFREKTGRTVTNVSSPTQSATVRKFLGKSGFFNGSSAISVPDHADWDLNGLSWTFDAWLYPTSVSGNQYVIGQLPSDGNATNTSWGILLASGTPRFYWRKADGSTAGVSSTTGALSVNQWAYIKIYSNGTNIYFLVNGTSGGNGALSGINTSSLDLHVGRAGLFPNYYTGYVDELRLRVGIADSSILVPTRRA